MARGIKELVLNDRDRFVLFLLDKFRVLDVKSLTVLAGFSSVNYADIRLLKLAKYGYIKREKLVSNLPIVHWLTKKEPLRPGRPDLAVKRTGADHASTARPESSPRRAGTHRPRGIPGPAARGRDA